VLAPPFFSLGSHASPPVVPAFVLPAAAAETAVVVNNELRDHNRQPKGLGTGIRAVTFGNGVAGIPESGLITITGNSLLNNSFGISVDANGAAPTGSIGNATVTLLGNTMSSCHTDLLVSFSRISRALGVSVTEKYLQNSTYRLQLNGNVALSNVWYDNPSASNNSLFVDGALVPAATQIPLPFKSAICS